MSKFLLILAIVSLGVSGFAAQNPTIDNKVVRVIKIRHISPYLLAFLLSGHTTFSTPSEPLIRK